MARTVPPPCHLTAVPCSPSRTPLQELKERHREVLQEMLMDILRALTSPNLDIRSKTLDIALDLVSARNVDEVVGVLKKEAVKTQVGAGSCGRCRLRWEEVVALGKQGWRGMAVSGAWVVAGMLPGRWHWVSCDRLS